VRSWSQDLPANAIRAADIPEARCAFLAAPRHSRSTFLVGKLHERLDRWLGRVKIDDLKKIRGSGQSENAVDLCPTAHENEPATGARCPHAGLNDHA
jgi:hypothetical protein